MEVTKLRTGDEVKIVIIKNAGEDGYQSVVVGNSNEAILLGLKKAMFRAAKLMRMPVDKLYAVLATVIFTPALEVREDD